jgi:hypothetical protein
MQQRNGGFSGFRIPSEYNENPKNSGSTMEILGVRWESQECTGNLGSTMEIPAVKWESREYDGNPECKMKIPGVKLESREYDGNPWSKMGIPGVQWESQEYNRNPWSTMKILKIPGVHHPPFPPWLHKIFHLTIHSTTRYTCETYSIQLILTSSID